MAENVGGIEYTLSIDTARLIRGEREASRSLSRLGDEGDRLGTRFTAMASAVSAALSAIAVGALVSKVVEAQRQFDVLFASLKTMTGGADQAAMAWERLVDFAATTPYSLEQAVQGFVKLKALGLDPSERAMTSFGNTAAAMGKDLMQMIEAVADASTGEFERLKEFGIKSKAEGDKVTFTFQNVKTTIQNNAQAINEYLTKIGENQFAGAMSERMKTLDGDISNLSDSMQALYLSVSQSGFGDVVATSVQKATQAVQELTQSIKQGELTEYFDALKPVIVAAEYAVVSLSAVITGRLVAAFVAAAAQAYATATAIGAATIAARGFAAVISLMGGPVGVAVTALTLLAFNWDKIAGSAKTAAQISEESADRIAKAQKKSSERASKDLNSQLAEAEKGLKEAQDHLKQAEKPNIYGQMSKQNVLDGYQDQIDAYRQSIADIKTALSGLGGGAGRGKINPDLVRAAPEPDAPEKPKGAKKQPLDQVAYMAEMRAKAASEFDKIGIDEAESIRKADLLLKSKELSEVNHAETVQLIRAAAAKDRQALSQKELDDLVQSIETDERLKDEAAKAEQQRQQESIQYAASLTKAINPVDALRQEYEAKLQLVQQYEQMMATAGVDATAQAEATKAQIRTEYELQRTALAEQTFRSQDEANAFLIDSLNSLSQTATTSITGLLQGTMSAQDAMRGLASTVLNEAVGALVQIGMQQIKNALLADTLAAADKARAAANGAVYAASVGAQVAGMSALAAQNAFAATAAIPIVGPGLAPAAAALAGTAAAAIGAPAVAAAPLAGARQYGGPVSADSLYRVNERGAPEMYTASNGAQYMLPTANGQVTAANKIEGGGSVQWNIVVNNTAAGTMASASVDQQSRTVQIAVTEVAQQISNNSGPVWSAMRGSTNIRSAL